MYQGMRHFSTISQTNLRRLTQEIFQIKKDFARTQGALPNRLEVNQTDFKLLHERIGSSDIPMTFASLQVVCIPALTKPRVFFDPHLEDNDDFSFDLIFTVQP